MMKRLFRAESRAGRKLMPKSSQKHKCQTGREVFFQSVEATGNSSATSQQHLLAEALSSSPLMVELMAHVYCLYLKLSAGILRTLSFSQLTSLTISYMFCCIVKEYKEVLVDNYGVLLLH